MPTYGEKYFSVYKEAPLGNLGLTPWLFMMRFSVASYTGASTEIELYADNTCIIEMVDGGVYDPIKSTKATFRFRCPSEAVANTFYITDDREVKLELLYSGDGTGNQWRRLWTGWALPTDLKVKYGTFPALVEVSGTDGIATLKDRLLLDASGKRLTSTTNLIPLSRVLRTGLSQVGYTVPVTTGVNIYELQDMAAGQTVNGRPDPNKDPLHYTAILAQSLLTSQNSTLSAYDALKNFETFGVRIGQACGEASEGDFYALRIPDMVGGNDPNGTADTIRTRRYNNTDFTTPPTTGTSVSRNLVVEVGARKSVKVLKRSGPSTGLQSLKHAVRVEQSFGQTLSNIPNGDFSVVDSENFPLQWKRNNLSNALREGAGTDADPYRLTLYGNGDEKINGDTPCAYVTIEFNRLSPDFTKSIERTFDCDFTCVGIRAGKVAIIADTEKENGANVAYLLEAGGGWTNKISKKSPAILTQHSFTANNVMQSKQGKASMKITASGLARTLRWRIYLCVGESLDRLDDNGKPIGAYDNPGNKISYFNLRLSESDPAINLTGTQYTIAKPGRTPETIASFVWGDVPDAVKPYSRTGALFRTDTNTATSGKWFRAVESFPAQQGLGLLQLVGNDRAKQLMLSAPTFEGTLAGRLPHGLFSVIRIDDVVDRNGELIKSILTRWKWNTRKCEHDVTAHRVMADGFITGVTLVKEWQTPDGTLPISIDESGITLPPSDIKQAVDNAPVSPLPDLTGYTQADPAGPIIGADIYDGSIRVGRVVSAYQLQEELPA